MHGTVTAATDGDGWQVATERDGTPTAGSGGGGSHDDHDYDAGADDPSATPGGGGDGCGPGKVDINVADAEAMQQIVHLGPARSEEAVGLRPFTSVDGLQRVNGIGAGRMADIHDQGVACVG